MCNHWDPNKSQAVTVLGGNNPPVMAIKVQGLYSQPQSGQFIKQGVGLHARLHIRQARCCSAAKPGWAVKAWQLTHARSSSIQYQLLLDGSTLISRNVQLLDDVQ